MTYEKFYGSHDHYRGWRCISCGEILDQIILQNRARLGTTRTRGLRTRRKGSGKRWYVLTGKQAFGNLSDNEGKGDP